MKNAFALCSLVLILTIGCKEDEPTGAGNANYPAIASAFAGNIDPQNLPNYANQGAPGYITKDNTNGNIITDAGATLGRVLFYDKKLSVNNSIACASCHKQNMAFGDVNTLSTGANGNTGRHSMRLINARFAQEVRFFWDERANTLEAQTTQPIQDHAEMGFSGENGDPSIADLISKLEAVEYYKELFTLAFGDEDITENRMQQALAQFIRSIQSFDSKYDQGFAAAGGPNGPFNNFTQAENQGKQLFTAPAQFANNGVRTGGGAGCAGCHRPPEFDIDPQSRSNGVTTSTDSGTDVSNTRSPSLRDLTRSDGTLNGPLMHDGSMISLLEVIDHYNLGIQQSPNLDPRLRPNGAVQRLNLSTVEIENLRAFLLTLSGTDVYTNAKWSNPFP
jgi:cytochrome c peroxidase